MLKNNLPHNRICFTCVKGFGIAVERNRAKRLGREAYRSLKPQLHQGYDLILLVYPQETKVMCADRIEQLRFVCTKAGLLC